MSISLITSPSQQPWSARAILLSMGWKTTSPVILQAVTLHPSHPARNNQAKGAVFSLHACFSCSYSPRSRIRQIQHLKQSSWFRRLALKLRIWTYSGSRRVVDWRNGCVISKSKSFTSRETSQNHRDDIVCVSRSFSTVNLIFSGRCWMI